MDPPSIVAGRFEVQALAGRGATGAVYRARDRLDGATVALKVLLFDVQEAGQRFLREAGILASLAHPGIVRYVAHGLSDSKAYLALEWIEGETLARRLSRGPLAIADAALVAARVADALVEPHRRRIVHRDLKPSNLMLPFGVLKDVKILDFGLARLPDVPVTRSGTTIGTPGYMAPEQARGEAVDVRADVFSLGCILYQCIAGRAPFVADDLVAVLLKIVLEDPPPLTRFSPRVPAALEALVFRMLSKDRTRRPADAQAVAAELSDCLADPDAPPSMRSGAITASERRSLSLVLARGPALSTAVRAAVARCDAECDVLPDGTAIVAITGRAVATDRAAQAARCALAIRDAWPEAAVVVVSGRSEPMADGPFAEVIEQAVALLQLGDTNTIRIDEASFGLLDARFDVVADAASVVLRGERGGSDAVRTLLGRPTPFVGRDRELASLSSAFEECASEARSMAVLVTGPAGAGKSRLRYELLRRLREAESITVWIGRADPLRAGTPFGLASFVLRDALDLRDGEPLAARQRKMAARTRRNLGAPDAARVAAFLGEIVGTPAGETSVQLAAARLDPTTMWDQIRQAFVDFVRAEARAAPMIIVLEDLHWGDAPTIELFDRLLSELRDVPLLVLALARPEVTEIFPNLWRERAVDVIRLGDLGRRSAERLVRSVLGHDVEDASIRLLVDRAAGNAFYLEEVIRAFAEDEGESLPDTVLAMAEARLSRLDADARRVLRAASVFGETFTSGAVAALLGDAEPAERVATELAKLVAAEAIGTRAGGAGAAGAPQYVFRHGLVREAAYATLPEVDRKLAHRLAAQWLEAAGEPDASVLAEHHHRGGAIELAARWFERAAQSALSRQDLVAARARADRAVECGASGEALGRIRLLQAEAWRLGGGQESGVLARAEDAMRLLPEGGGAWHQAVMEVAFAANAVGQVERLEQTAELLLRATPAPEAASVRPYALATVALQLDMVARLELVKAVIAKLDEDLCAAPPDPMTEGTLWLVRARDAMASGDTGGYCSALQRSTACYDLAGATRLACRHRGATGFAYLLLGAYAEAEVWLRACLEAAERMGMATLVAEARHNLGLALAYLGRLDEATATERSAMQSFAALGHRRMEVSCWLYLAMISLRAGRTKEAVDIAVAAVAASSTLPPLHMQAHCVLADARLAEADASAALEAARAALDLMESSGVNVAENESYARRVHAEALHAVGDREGARHAIRVARDRVLERASRIEDPTWRGWFTENEVDNAKILALAGAWLGQPAP